MECDCDIFVMFHLGICISQQILSFVLSVNVFLLLALISYAFIKQLVNILLKLSQRRKDFRDKRMWWEIIFSDVITEDAKENKFGPWWKLGVGKNKNKCCIIFHELSLVWWKHAKDLGDRFHCSHACYSNSIQQMKTEQNETTFRSRSRWKLKWKPQTDNKFLSFKFVSK